MVKYNKILKFILILISLIKSTNSSECLDLNKKVSNSSASLTSCTKVIMPQSDDEANLQCCYLLIRPESGVNIRKCIEIIKDEDEIEKRKDALELMYKNAEEISIECENGYLIKFLPINLFFLIYLYF